MLQRFGVSLLGVFVFVLGWGAGATLAYGDNAMPLGPRVANTEMASIGPRADYREQEQPLPQVLSDDDVLRYRRIFDVQEVGDWKTADRLIAKLDDRILMGHVMAQRYLHPTKYRSKYKELKDWMAEYADHPSAQRIYKLALRRRPSNWKYPEKPVPVGSGLSALTTDARKEIQPPRKRMSKANRRKVAQLQSQIRSTLRHGWTLAAKRIIQSAEVKKLFGPYEYDKAQAALGARYFMDGRLEWALDWTGRAAKRSGKYIPTADWYAGLAAWRLGKTDLAQRYFNAVAESPNSDHWMVSAGAFWAARADFVGGKPDNVDRLLGIAAAYPRTFYGLLARRILGIEPSFRWVLPPLESAAVEELAETPAGRRALALVEAGQEERASADLKLLASRASPGLARGIMALAARAGMPALAVRLNDALFPHGGGFDGAAYPLPHWEPDEGFRVDRALIYALIRQESKFNPNAKSWVGARGLMQLMPRTASFVARDRSLHGSKRSALYEPSLNLELGQSYIEMLLDERYISGDLFRLAIAWNGGPGNLLKWQKAANIDDPLLFIESIPSRETRIFVERVLSNLWIYRDRMGQTAPSLDAIAAGDKPVYIPQDKKTSVAAGQHVEN